MSERTEPRTFTARWVFPVSGPPLPNGTVTVRGEHIEAVLPHGERAPDEDFGNAAIIPGLVNPHTHLDLSGARGLIPPTAADHFTDWLRGVIGYRRTRTPEQTQSDIRTGLAECLRHGTTLIGDIASEGASWDALAGAPTRAVVYFELIGLSEQSSVAALERRYAWHRSLPKEHATCRTGRSPHAPYSVSGGLLTSAHLFHVPAAIHLAEVAAEADLLERREGVFVDFLQQLGVWKPDLGFADWSLIVQMTSVELFAKPPNYTAPPVLFVHANYLPPTVPWGSNHFVCYCPRTHAAFGHAPHPFREFLARGVRVCLGTDSLASNPDLDVLSEARFVRTRYPDFPGDQLLRMVTLSGAESLGWADETGSLEANKSADFVVVPLPNADVADPHELVLTDHAGDRRTMFRGAWRTQASSAP
ncbi:amidohydrolase family protein [Gemmata sp. G18]|uniref:Amidohydrolase family protein n=1 Tax=Gemmata palustris TaxID=2822762 RepID=A0ABS5C205_9BACT|nr:amidohydrolase family protein [Gemmata palustris]MBP3959996.1 amidohydrolase family protein [Gemmata palustris]